MPKSPYADRHVAASARFWVPSERAAGLQGDLIDWMREEHESAGVMRSGPEEITITAKTVADQFPNGTLSACAYLGTMLERALTELCDVRWFGGATITASLVEARDPADLKIVDDEEAA